MYFGLIVSFEAVATPGRFGWILALGLANAGPPALLSWIVALNRHRLLRPEWGFLKTLGVHKVVGLSFAVATAGLITVISNVFDLMPSEGVSAGGWLMFLYRTVSSAFLYIVFFGILMWSESIRRVQESYQAAARESVLRAEAEARAIRAQFNPHFVFNTLHSLMLLVRADPAAAEKAIEDVAVLIRYASILQRKDVDAVPLAKEVEVARRYVGLEQLRLDDRLEVEWDVQEGASDLTIPAFALQILVENAIKHGIEPSPEGGRVLVEIRVEDEMLAVRVTDDGMGCDPAAVKSTTGHGLHLLGQRLRAMHGEHSSLEWTTSPNNGFSAFVTLPAKRSPSSPELGVIPETVHG